MSWGGLPTKVKGRLAEAGVTPEYWTRAAAEGDAPSTLAKLVRHVEEKAREDTIVPSEAERAKARRRAPNSHHGEPEGKQQVRLDNEAVSVSPESLVRDIGSKLEKMGNVQCGMTVSFLREDGQCVEHGWSVEELEAGRML